MYGEHETIEEWNRHLRPYYGRRVRVVLNGYRTDPDTDEKYRTQIVRVIQLDGYGDMFGPASAMMKMAKVLRNRYSKDELVTTSISVELADDGDGDGESLGGE